MRDAQQLLLGLLSYDLHQPNSMLEKYTHRSYKKRIRGRKDEFLLHKNKPLYELVDFLFHNGLMWHAEFADTSADTAVHPMLGEVIMSVIAMACANDEGFDVVTDEGRVHYEISTSDVPTLYRSLISPVHPKAETFKATERQLSQLIIFQQCDVSKLSLNRLAELSKDHEAIDAFRSALAMIAQRIPEMQSSHAFEDRLKGAVDDALNAWRRDRANMTAASKEVFGSELLLKPTGDFVKTLVERFAAPLFGAATGAAEGGLRGALIGAAGGFVVALLVHTTSSWIKAKQHERQSPYRYLTQLEKAGVAFTIAH